MPTMRKTLLAALLALAAGGAWAQVEVLYSKPEEFSDVPFNVRDREQLLKEISAHFARLAKQLPAGQNLKVEVLDVDLAGRTYPRHFSPDEIRVMRGGADWPTMHLRYTLQQGGALLRSGDEHLSNMAYQDRVNRYSSGDPLRYEKQMMDDWFQKTFPPSTVAQH